MALEQGIAARLLHSQALETRGFLPLFEILSRLGVQCREPESNTVVEPIKYYQTNPLEDFYSLSVDSHQVEMGLSRTKGHMFLSASLDYLQDERNEDMIQALCRLLDALFPALAFAFAYIDLEGDPPPKLSADIEATRIRWLFWTNYFGKSYVDKFGKDFFLHAPGWRNEEMRNGIVKYVISPSPRIKMDATTKKAITAYFAQETKVKIYSRGQFGFK
ncbi:hypothetical protein L6R21_21920 [bacterium]|nr:hypothetical protein [bacterium]